LNFVGAVLRAAAANSFGGMRFHFVVAAAAPRFGDTIGSFGAPPSFVTGSPHGVLLVTARAKWAFILSRFVASDG
jgi:hypothetical protein